MGVVGGEVWVWLEERCVFGGEVWVWLEERCGCGWRRGVWFVVLCTCVLQFPSVNGGQVETPCIAFLWTSSGRGEDIVRVKMESITPSTDRHIKLHPKDGRYALFGWHLVTNKDRKVCLCLCHPVVCVSPCGECLSPCVVCVCHPVW